METLTEAMEMMSTSHFKGGQGNGASLSLWLAISCILLAVLESAVQGVHNVIKVTYVYSYNVCG